MINPFTIQLDDKPNHRSDSEQGLARSGKGHEIEEFNVDPGPTPYLGVSTNRRMFAITVILFLSIFGIFLGRAAYLQMARGSYYRGVAEGNRIRIEIIPATRGLVFDQNNIPLIWNVPRFVLAVKPLDFPKESDPASRTLIFDVLATYDVDQEAVLEILKTHPRSNEWFSVKEPLDHKDAIQLIAALHDAVGVTVRIETRRQYATDLAQSFSHVLGYVGKSADSDLPFLVGKTGLEFFYETQLRGQTGQKQIEVDALGNEKQIIAKEDPVDGEHLILGIDAAFQKKAEQVLADTMRTAGKKKGIVIALDPRNGEIRALVSLPSYNDNEFSGGISQVRYDALANDSSQPLFFRAISGLYPSGSTIKPVFAAGALEEGIITPRTTILSTGGIRIGQWFFPDWKAGGHSAVNVYQAIAESVNTFFYYISGGYNNFVGLGPDKMAFWLQRFGFGSPTGIDLPNEAAGFVPTPAWKNKVKSEPWYIGDTYHFGIGQGDFLVTPLQIAEATATIANGGTRYEPHLIRAFRLKDGQEIPVSPVVLGTQVASAKTLKIIAEAMRQTVTNGSARSLNSLSVAVAGKTGTAQWNTKLPNHAWFEGFAPFENPELVIVVLVEEGGEGSTIAVPIAKELFVWYFNSTVQP